MYKNFTYYAISYARNQVSTSHHSFSYISNLAIIDLYNLL